MKKILSKCIMVVVAFVSVSVFAINTSNAQGRVSLQVFYDELSPYGTWVDNRDYGYVWVPNVDRGFTPYSTNGYWINTEYGNTWVSDYSWGWAPFHYGRWFYDDFYGWVWVPDTEWAPAWVAWRDGGGYYGWAPLMPGIGFSVSYTYYDRIPDHYWNFVPHRYIMYRHVHTHFVPRPRVTTIIHNTTIITNNYQDRDRRHTYFTGPSRTELERSTKSRVEVHKVSTRNSPGKMDVRRGTVNVYRPDVDDSRESRGKAVPARVSRDTRGGKQPVERPNQEIQNSNRENRERKQKQRSVDEPQQQVQPEQQNSNRQKPAVERSSPTELKQKPVKQSDNKRQKRKRKQ